MLENFNKKGKILIKKTLGIPNLQDKKDFIIENKENIKNNLFNYFNNNKYLQYFSDIEESYKDNSLESKFDVNLGVIRDPLIKDKNMEDMEFVHRKTKKYLPDFIRQDMDSQKTEVKYSAKENKFINGQKEEMNIFLDKNSLTYDSDFYKFISNIKDEKQRQYVFAVLSKILDKTKNQEEFKKIIDIVKNNYNNDVRLSDFISLSEKEDFINKINTYVKFELLFSNFERLSPHASNKIFNFINLNLKSEDINDIYNICELLSKYILYDQSSFGNYYENLVRSIKEGKDLKTFLNGLKDIIKNKDQYTQDEFSETAKILSTKDKKMIEHSILNNNIKKYSIDFLNIEGYKDREGKIHHYI